MGSGSSGVAAKETGRDYIGIELSPENYKLASVRLQEAVIETKQENKAGFFK